MLFWLGAWSAMYGAMHLGRSVPFLLGLPRWVQNTVPLANTMASYLMIVVASLAWVELSLGILRRIVQAVVVLGMVVAAAGIAWFLATGSQNKLMAYNNLLAVVASLALLGVVLVPSWSRKYIVLRRRGVLAAGVSVFAVEAFYNNLSHSMPQLRLPTATLFDHLGFAALLFAFGYIGLNVIAASEHRLLAIENELAIARQIQSSILPTDVPEICGTRIAATYQPMTSVAGDFYEFIPVDHHHAGFLVADVCGHGVPAALIASMLKVAMQSVVSVAGCPGEVLRGLNRILSGQLRGQLVSAAYLWLDMENHKALYSAAGHPPLLHWQHGKLQQVESNGILFGVLDDAEYPVRALQLHSGDRLLLYTDGVTEPENASGEAFGERRLEQLIRDKDAMPPSELCNEILRETRSWQPAANGQQDDITLVVVELE